MRGFVVLAGEDLFRAQLRILADKCRVDNIFFHQKRNVFLLGSIGICPLGRAGFVSSAAKKSCCQVISPDPPLILSHRVGGGFVSVYFKDLFHGFVSIYFQDLF